MQLATIQRRVTTSTGQDPGRELLQARLALFGRMIGVLALIYLVFINLFHPAPRTLDTYLSRANFIVLCVAATGTIVWLLTRSAPRDQRPLRVVDATGTIMVCVLAALYGWMSDYTEGSGYAGLLATTNVLAFRAAVVPSTGRRTLQIGIAGAVPAVLLALTQFVLPNMIGGEGVHIGYVLA